MSYKNNKTKLLNKYPAVSDLATKAKRRIPHVAWEYLDSGTGIEHLKNLNRTALNAVRMTPRFCRGKLTPNVETELFGNTFSAPFGMAPVGLTGLMWSQAEILLAQSAVRCNIPFSLSTVATETPERVGRHVGENGWFQLYPPKERHLRADLLRRAWESGFKVLLITADVPERSSRERSRRAGLQNPPKFTPGFVWQGLTHPAWSLATLRRGLPQLRTVTGYTEFKDAVNTDKFVRSKLGGNLSWEICEELRDTWPGAVVLKGILHPADAEKAAAIGLDGIVVSNHGGRQFDGGPAAIDALPDVVRTANGRLKILFDSGIRTGLDIMRALHLGADFVLAGRPFMYGVCALGKYGGDHVFQIFYDDLKNNMAQYGTESIAELRRKI